MKDIELKFYVYAYESNYEELIAHYPRFYREVFEMVEILKAHGRALDLLESRVEQVFFNHFVLTADEPTIEEWEDLFGLKGAGLTLDQRRHVIIGLLCGAGHIGEPEIRIIVGNYTDHEMRLDFKEGVIYLYIEGEIPGEELLYETLLKRIPAHLALWMRFDTHRSFRHTLNFNFGGAIGAEVWSKFVAVERRYSQELPITPGTLLTPDIKATPMGEDRRKKSEIDINTLAFATGENTSAIPDAEKTILAKTKGGRGFIYRTRLTSKLIKEEG